MAKKNKSSKNSEKLNVEEEKKELKNKKANAYKLVLGEFLEFLKEYKILGIAAGLVIGSAVTTLTQALVNGLITPAFQLLIPSDAIQGLTYQIKGVTFDVGVVVSAFINFLVIAWLFFMFVKFFFREKKISKDLFKTK